VPRVSRYSFKIRYMSRFNAQRQRVTVKIARPAMQTRRTIIVVFGCISESEVGGVYEWVSMMSSFRIRFTEFFELIADIGLCFCRVLS
jgi:hypothetical protein